MATEVFTWNITSPITISAIADQTKSENSPIGNLTVSATDSNSNGTPTLTYSATGLPPGLQMSTSSSGNTTSGVISGSIALGAAANSPYSVTVVAEDGTYASTQSFTWTITCPVTLPTLADQSNNEGDRVNVSAAGTDWASGTLVYGAVGLPPGLQISTGNGTISGTVAAGASANSPYTITVAAKDGT